MKRDYRFENVICKGKRFGFIIHNVKNFVDAKKKAADFCLKKLDLDKTEFKSTLNYLNQTIENGETRVTPLKKEEQLGFNLELPKFETRFEELYSGLINEMDSYKYKKSK